MPFYSSHRIPNLDYISKLLLFLIYLVTSVLLNVCVVDWLCRKDDLFLFYGYSEKLHLKTIFMILKAKVFYGQEFAPLYQYLDGVFFSVLRKRELHFI